MRATVCVCGGGGQKSGVMEHPQWHPGEYPPQVLTVSPVHMLTV